MKKNNFINGLFATLLIASPIVGADQKYPAADFQPQVVFQDNDLIAKGGDESKAVAKSVDVAVDSGVDSKYPAASFQPQVVYSDPNYKSSASIPKPSKIENLNSEVVSDSVENSSVSGAEKKESQSIYLIGLVALGLVGGFLFKNQSKCSGQKNTGVSSQASVSKGGLTGVARYLNKVSGTGVSRYLEKQVKSAPATGVAKYLAKQVIVAKSSASDAATGVEKYMRNRG